MKKILIFITVLLLLSCCAHEEKDVFSIYANFVNRKPNDRNGEDYIKLWVNDTLLFNNTYYTNYIESTMTNTDDAVKGMHLVDVEKKNRDSLKIRIRVISLDSILFGNKRVWDSTFHYRIDNIPGMTIHDSRLFPEDERSFFHFLDPVKDPYCWFFEY
jgi:lipoprotein